MSLDALYADSIDAGLQNWAANPGPAPDIGFSLTSTLAAGAKAIPGAALEVGGSVSDLLSGFGNILGATAGSAGGMFSLPSSKETKEREQARQKMLMGDSFDVSGGNAARAKADSFYPDPLTAHTADHVVSGFVRFGAKAIGAVATMGPAGAIPLAMEEGNTVTQRLRSEGVDTETAAKVGAVQGVISGAGVVLPLGGKTIMQTLGLVALGGPGSFMAQEKLSKEILQQAGYADQASLHNPFDPLGLAVSTILPGAFGALHMRGQFKRGEAVKAGTLGVEQLQPQELRSLKFNDPRLDAYAEQSADKYGVPRAVLLAVKNAGEKSESKQTSPKGAKGVMQFMESTAKEMGLADRTDPLASIDAGSRYLKKLFDAYGSWDAAVAHYNGGGAQAAIVRGGGKPTFNETRGYLERVQKYVSEYEASQVAKSPESVDAARVSVLNETVARSLPDTPDAYAQVMRAADVVAERGGRAAESAVPDFIAQRDSPQSEVVLHGSSAEFDEFQIMPGRNPALFFSEPNGRKTQAEHISEGPFGGVLYRVELESGKKFDPYNDPEAAQIFKALFPERDVKQIEYTDIYNGSPLMQAMRENGYNRVRVYEPSVQGFSEAITDPSLARIVASKDVRTGGEWRSVDSAPAQLREPPRESNNSLPPADSVSIAGDTSAPRTSEVGTRPITTEASATPRDPQVVQREIELATKRRSNIEALLECLRGS